MKIRIIEKHGHIRLDPEAFILDFSERAKYLREPAQDFHETHGKKFPRVHNLPQTLRREFGPANSKGLNFLAGFLPKRVQQLSCVSIRGRFGGRYQDFQRTTPASLARMNATNF